MGFTNCRAFNLSLASKRSLQWTHNRKFCSPLAGSLIKEKTLFRLPLDGERASLVNPIPARTNLPLSCDCGTVGDIAESSCDTGLVIFPTLFVMIKKRTHHNYFPIIASSYRKLCFPAKTIIKDFCLRVRRMTWNVKKSGLKKLLGVFMWTKGCIWSSEPSYK